MLWLWLRYLLSIFLDRSGVPAIIGMIITGIATRAAFETGSPNYYIVAAMYATFFVLACISTVYHLILLARASYQRFLLNYEKAKNPPFLNHSGAYRAETTSKSRQYTDMSVYDIDEQIVLDRYEGVK